MKLIESYEEFVNESSYLNDPDYPQRDVVLEMLKKEVIHGDLCIGEDCIFTPEELRQINTKKVTGDLRFHMATKCNGKLPKYLKNIKVDGYCSVSYNYLTSLENCPQVIGGTFVCAHNNLKSLEGGPIIVKGNYKCEYNKLTSLKGAPHIIYRDLHCGGNELIDLEKGPQIVRGDIWCSYNKDHYKGHRLQIPKHMDFYGELFNGEPRKR